MTLAIPARGRHTVEAVTAKLRRQIHALDRDNSLLVATVEDRERELHTALVRGCQDAMLIAHLREQLTGAVAGIRETQRALVRAKAEQERLRQAVVSARPKITVAYVEPARPYVSHVVLPYAVPVGQSTANDETQQLPVIDLPQGVV